MVLETEPIIFGQWLRMAAASFFSSALLLLGAALVVGYLVAAFRHGPLAGGDVVFQMVKTSFLDLVRISPRRVTALTRLAIWEAVRRKTLVGLAVFVLALLFAGWFLDPRSNNPSRLYISFVITAATYLVLLVGLFISTLSLPADFKNRTIYTVATKPVRMGEILLGRIIGFSLIGTAILAVMGVASYLFVVRILAHQHQLLASPSAEAGGERKTIRTTTDRNHWHEATVDADGAAATDLKQGHWHDVLLRGEGSEARHEIGPAQGDLLARVPSYGKLRFRDRQGRNANRGISVGAEWRYRSYVEGGTPAAAIWTFDNLSAAEFPDGFPLEMTIRVFRSYKGDNTRGILGSLMLKNPNRPVSAVIDSFQVKDMYVDRRDVPRKLKDAAGNPVDLFDDLVADGRVEVWLQCLEAEQYFGMAQADLYLHRGDASFAANFAKGFVSVWLQMALVISFGVMFSTFLSGPVAMLSSVAAIIMGFCAKFIVDVATGRIKGGGPIESAVRIFNQQNLVVEMNEGLARSFVKSVDALLMSAMETLVGLLPDFGRYNTADYLAYGFDIPADEMWAQVCSIVGYLAAVFVAGYFFLRTREVAR